MTTACNLELGKQEGEAEGIQKKDVCLYIIFKNVRFHFFPRQNSDQVNGGERGEGKKLTQSSAGLANTAADARLPSLAVEACRISPVIVAFFVLVLDLGLPTVAEDEDVVDAVVEEYSREVAADADDALLLLLNPLQRRHGVNRHTLTNPSRPPVITHILR